MTTFAARLGQANSKAAPATNASPATAQAATAGIKNALENFSLLSLVNRVNETKARNNLTMLLYGPAKTGKTTLASTIARIKYLKRIYWFDIENGLDAIILAYQQGRLTDEDMAKIIPIRVVDTKQSPLATETLLKALCGRRAVKISLAEGKVLPDNAQGTEGVDYVTFDYNSLTDSDAIVIDSLSQFGQSTLNAATLGKPTEYKLQLDDYGASQKWGYDLLTTIQAAAKCHIICITHVRIEDDELGAKKIMPLMGSSTTSANVAKHFNTVVYLEKQLKQLRATSDVLGSVSAQTGSRIGMELEKMKEPCLATALIEAGYFPAND